jgi:hypothetical protein
VCEVGSTAFIELVKDHDFIVNTDNGVHPSRRAR